MVGRVVGWGERVTDYFIEVEQELRKRYEGWEGERQFEGSGRRLRSLVEELCWDSKRIGEEVEKHFEAVFEDPFDEMLVTGPTLVWTLCPHHLLPVEFKCWIGYIPMGKVLGLSKFSRVAITLGKRPIMQEMYSRELADAIATHLSPEGVGVYIIGKHGCIGCRGINQDVDITTSVLRGSFKGDSTVRQEFYNIVLGGIKSGNGR